MNQYNIITLRDSFLLKARSDGVDDLGQPVERLVAEGGEPCRDALRRAKPGEALILASYCPFERAGPYREYGPVFVLAEAEQGAATRKQDYLGAAFVLRAYSARERIVDAVISSRGQADAHLARLFGIPEVAFVLARLAAYGCYALRLER